MRGMDSRTSPMLDNGEEV